jgi:uncharacterized caspase-like protein
MLEGRRMATSCFLRLHTRMHRILKIFLFLLALAAIGSASSTTAAPAERRVALVIGNASYRAKTLATPANDAALVAQSLQGAGFDVMGARDLDADSLRSAFRDFFASVTKAGPGTVAAVYFAGYALQLQGENYLVPVDANITSDSDVSRVAFPLSNITHALSALHLKSTFVILDAARASPFTLSSQPLAGGLAWVRPEPNMLIALNAAPGTVAPDGLGGYGPYARALTEMIRQGGLTPGNLFDRVRLRVNELTKGAQVPWDASRIDAQFVFFERASDAPPRTDLPEQTAWMRFQPMRSLGADDAYAVALLRDTFDGYGDFLADYWHEPTAKRIRALLAVRREAITWRRSHETGTPEAYWTYLTRYPRGPHAADARRLLTHLDAATEPPPKFTMIDCEVPPPLPDELPLMERPVLVFGDPEFAFAPPPALSTKFLALPEFPISAPPAAPRDAYILPAPALEPLPVYINVPPDVVPPPNPSVVKDINSAGNVARVTDPHRQVGLSSAVSPSDTTGSAGEPVDRPPLPPAITTLMSSRSLPSTVSPAEVKVPPRGALSEPPSTAAALGDSVAPATKQIAAVGLPPADDQRPPSGDHPSPIDNRPTSTQDNPPVASLPRGAPSSMDRSPLQPAPSLPLVGNIPLPISRPITEVRLATGSLPPSYPGAASLSQQMPEKNIPLPTPRPPVTVAPETIGNIPLPVPRAASLTTNDAHSPTLSPTTPTPQPAAVDQSLRRAGPAANQPSSPSALPPRAASGANGPQTLPPIPPGKICPLVNGRRICS